MSVLRNERYSVVRWQPPVVVLLGTPGSALQAPTGEATDNASPSADDSRGPLSI